MRVAQVDRVSRTLHGARVQSFRLLALLVLACASAKESGIPTDPPAAPTSADAATAEDAPCSTDADCALTRVAPGACCPMLCIPRAVTRSRAAELDANVRTCNAGKACPQPLCRPWPGGDVSVACQSGRCVTLALPKD